MAPQWKVAPVVGQCPWWDPSRGRHSGTGGGPAGLVLRLLRGRAGGGRGRLRDGATAVPRSLRRPPPLRNRGLREQPLRAPAAPPAGRVHRPAGPRLTWDLPRESRPVGGPQRRARLRRPLSEDPAAALTPRGPGDPTRGRTKETLQDRAAECTDLVGKQHVMEHSEGTHLWPRLDARPGGRP